MDESSEHLERVRALIAREPLDPAGPEGLGGRIHRLCCAASTALPAAGASVSVMTRTGACALVAASDAGSQAVTELQITLGEGPVVEAFSSGVPVLAPDLSDVPVGRWPGYSPAARQRGIQAAFAFPLRIGAARLGVFDLFRTEAGSVTPATLTQMHTFADVARLTLLDADEAVDGERRSSAQDFEGFSFEVYQAQGMIKVQLGVSLEEAMLRLRGHAFAADRRLADVARDVLARNLRLDRDAPYDVTGN